MHLRGSQYIIIFDLLKVRDKNLLPRSIIIIGQLCFGSGPKRGNKEKMTEETKGKEEIGFGYVS